MRQMKDSGIWWIGSIPLDWNIVKAKKCISISNGSDPHTEGNVPVWGSGEKQFKTCGEFKEPPAVLIGRKGTINKPRYIESRYWNVDTAFDVKPLRNTDLRFYYYLAISFDYDYYTSQTTLPSMTQTAYDNMHLPFPSLEEQYRISAYLDRQCGLIDNVIEKTKASIEEYKKLRQAVITQAVTKGVRGDRLMKDSGIEWIGEIPEEWIVCKIHNYCRLKTGSTPSTSNTEWFDGSIQWFTPGDFSDNYYLIESQRKLSQKAIDDEVCSLVDKDTVLLVGIGATAGKVGISNTPCYFNQQITAILSEKNVILSKYLLYWIVANTKFIRETANYTTLPILNNQTINNYLLLLPNNIEEQKEIAAYLDKKCTEIGTLITKKETFLTELESYKKSMIYEYVTGKKEVPQA